MDIRQKKLVESAMQGSDEAFEKLIEWKRKDILYIAMRLTSPAEAEDIAQEALVHAYRGISSLRDPEKFNSWLFGIVRNDSMRAIEKRKREKAVLLNPQEESMVEVAEERQEFLPAEYLEDEEKRKHLMQEIESLPLNNRECLLLFYYESMSYKEIADTLKTTQKNVANMLMRAKALLRERLGERAGAQLRFGAAPAAALPVLTQAFQIDASQAVSPEMCSQLSLRMHDYITIASAGAGAAAATTTSGTATATTAGLASMPIKVIAGIGISLALVGGGVAVYQATQPIESAPIEQAPIQEAPVAETAVVVEEAPAINTLADMLGTEEAALLESFALNGTDQATWDVFVADIEAQMTGQSTTQEGAIYTLYVLDKQDKRLVLLSKSLDDASVSVMYQFGTQEETVIPRMTTVVLTFDET